MVTKESLRQNKFRLLTIQIVSTAGEVNNTEQNSVESHIITLSLNRSITNLNIDIADKVVT